MSTPVERECATALRNVMNDVLRDQAYSAVKPQADLVFDYEDLARQYLVAEPTAPTAPHEPPPNPFLQEPSTIGNFNEELFLRRRAEMVDRAEFNGRFQAAMNALYDIASRAR